MSELADVIKTKEALKECEKRTQNYSSVYGLF